MHRLTWVALVPLYLTYLQAGGRSPGTLRLHRHYLRHLAIFAPRPGEATAGQVLEALAVPTWKPETRKSARSVFVTFYRWAHRGGYVDHDPTLGLPSVSVPPGQARPAPEAVLARALALAEPRTRLMLLLAAHAGLRCCEVARVHHEDLADGLLYVTGKGAKVRVVPLEHPELVAALTATPAWLFPSPRGGHLTPGTVTKAMSAALPDGWTGHTLRHRFATRAYAGTRDVLAVGRALGHSRPETTRRYVQLPPDALLAVVRAAA